MTRVLIVLVLMLGLARVVAASYINGCIWSAVLTKEPSPTGDGEWLLEIKVERAACDRRQRCDSGCDQERGVRKLPWTSLDAPRGTPKPEAQRPPKRGQRVWILHQRLDLNEGPVQDTYQFLSEQEAAAAMKSP